MPSELQRVAEQLLASLNEASRAVGYLHDRARKCREAAAWIGNTSNPSARTAATQLDEAARRCEEAAHHLSLAESRARQWVEQVVTGIRTAEPSGSTAERPLGPDGHTSASRRQRDQDGPADAKPNEAAGDGDETDPDAEPTPRIGDEEAWRLFGKLPIREETPLQRPKTRGLWIDRSGREHDLVSGKTDFYERVKAFLDEHGIGDDRGELMVPTHVEAKFAMYMRLNKLKHETIVVNQKPCAGKWSCERLLSYILPPGATLTVFGPDNFKQTYPLPPDERTDRHE